MARKSDVTYEIEKIYGFLNEKKKNQALVRVSWNGGPARVEIRNCWYDKDNEMHLGKGIVVEDDTVDRLIELLQSLPKPVNFNEIFAAAGGIIKKRSQGFQTEDGFIVLVPKKKGLI